MKFSKLASYLEKLEKTPSRNEMTAILAQLFKKADWQEIDKICYLLSGRLVPAYQGIEFNLAEKMMARALTKAYGVKLKTVTKSYKQKGDLGDVAAELAANSKFEIRNSKLSVVEVYDRLMEIATESGGGSQERKLSKMAGLLRALDPLSAKYVARIPTGNIRLGFSDITMLDALSVMTKGDKSARPQIEAAYNVTADIGKIAQKVKKQGIGGLKKTEALAGTPIRPSLAERLPTTEEIIKKAGPRVAVEPKLDGFRSQIHIFPEKGKKKIAIFSRNLENTTLMFPEIVAAAEKLPVKSAILDGEAIGYNPKTGKFSPFQETVQRKRKYDITAWAKKIPLTVFVFDILFLDGKSLLSLPFLERRKLLEKVVLGHEDGLPAGKAGLKLAEQIVTADPKVVERELAKNVSAGLEGLVVKKTDAAYQAGARSFHWIKFKATSAALGRLRAGEKVGLLDTVDCMVMGAYAGRGKRAAFGVGSFLLGVLGLNDKYYAISNLGSGLTDEQFHEVYKRVKKLTVVQMPKEYVVDKTIEPDRWIKPKLVLEVLADQISLSPRHTAGAVEGGRGYSLRFPRLVRFRDDKNPEDVTTVAEVEKLYKMQRRK